MKPKVVKYSNEKEKSIDHLSFEDTRSWTEIVFIINQTSKSKQRTQCLE